MLLVTVRRVPLLVSRCSLCRSVVKVEVKVSDLLVEVGSDHWLLWPKELVVVVSVCPVMASE